MTRTIALPLALFFALVLASGAGAGVSLDISVGFESTFRPESWTSLSVIIKGAPSAASASLQLVVSSREGSRTYSKPIRLQPGVSDAHSLTYFQPNPASMPNLTVQLISEGRKLAERKVDQSLYVGDTQPALVALTQDRGGFGFLHRVELGFQHPVPENRQTWNPFGGGGLRSPSRGPGSGNPTRVLYPAPGELPDNAYAYKWVDAVILADLSLDTLTDVQWGALSQWVRDGGALVVSGGADLNRFRAKQLGALLPIAPTGVRQLSSLPALGQRYQTPISVSGVPVVTGALRSDASAICIQGDVTLVSTRRSGNGIVVFTAFDLLNSELRAWPGQPALWEEIMQVSQGDPKATDLLKTAASGSWNGSYRGLADALGGVQSTEAPSFTFIGLFLLAYIILLVPVNYMILKKWDKKELAWLTAPVIILIFTTGAYAVGYSVKGGTLFLRYATVIEGAAGSEDFNAFSIASVFSPRQTRYNVSVSDASALAGEVTMEPGGVRATSSSDLVVEFGRKTLVKDALISMWDIRNFSFESHVDLGGAVTASVIPGSGSHRVKVTNNTRHTLEDAMVSYSGVPTRVGKLGPGEDWEGQVVMNQLGATGRMGPVLDTFSPASSSAGRIKNAMAATITSNEAALAGNRSFIFSGWFTGSVNGLALEGERPKVEGQNLLVIHLPHANASGVRQAEAPQSSFGAFGNLGSRVPLPPSPPVAGGSFTRAQQLNELAYQHARQNRLREALDAAYQALALAPQEGNILDTVAEMHQLRKEYAQADTYYRRALAQQGGGGIPETNVKYGETLLALKRKTEAISHFQHAAARDYGQWGARARSHLTKLGISAPSPGQANSSPSTTLTIPLGSAIPAMPSTPGRGRRRILQPAPRGGFNMIVQEWQNDSGGRRSSQSQQYIPPGQPIPP